LFEIQKKIQYKNITTEETRYLTNTIQTGVDSTTAGGTPGGNNTNTSTNTAQNSGEGDFKKYISMAYYYDNDIPKPDAVVQPYQIYYNAYTSSTIKQEYQNNSNDKEGVALFFKEVIEDNKSQLDEMLVRLNSELKNNQYLLVEVLLESSASAPASDTYNISLSQRRMTSVVEYITGFQQLGQYLSAGRLNLVTGRTLGENATVTPISRTSSFNTFQCDSRLVGDSLAQSNAEVYSVNAMACRRTAIKNITLRDTSPVKQPSRVDPTDPKVIEQVSSNVDRKTVTQQVITDETVLRDNITKRVLRNLLTECDYFEVVKEQTPMVYDSLKEKLKFFHPAFHSMTPEGLNSRLTFLQQCMRPGDTIPTVSVDKQGNQTLQYNNAVNTSFGTPPILVLRLGDFWHSKIVPENLQISYEELDLNPEGIGVQPMIANIQFSFNFVGGQGLKESVDKLQNALSFNYYANTEIYDDRADVTDTSYQILDKEFLQALNIEVPPPTINQVENNQPQSNLETIGRILTTDIQQTGTTGTIEYKSFMTNLVGGTQTYFNTIVSKNKDVLRQYNNAVRQSFAITRRYVDGAVLANGTGSNVSLYGKPSSFETVINKVFADYLNDIKNENDAFIVWLSDPSKNFNKKVIRQVKDNMTVYVKQKQNEFASALSTIIQGITEAQTQYIQQLARANTVSFYEVTNPSEGTDGFQQTNGNVVVYSISGTTDVSPASVGITNTWVEMNTDIQKVAQDLQAFYTTIFTKFDWASGSDNYSGYFAVPENQADGLAQDVFYPFTTSQIAWNDQSVKREYYILSKDVIDDNQYETFKNAIISNIVGTNLLTPGNTAIDVEFDAYWKTKMRPIFVKENQVTEQYMNAFEKEKLPIYLVYTPFTLEKKRVLTYRLTLNPPPTNAQIQLIKNLGLKNNSDNDTSKWGVANGNVITSKVQLL
jgi:outer membrane protein OmpA-like peptidoglycan-associated protein